MPFSAATPLPDMYNQNKPRSKRTKLRSVVKFGEAAAKQAARALRPKAVKARQAQQRLALHLIENKTASKLSGPEIRDVRRNFARSTLPFTKRRLAKLATS